MSKMKDHLQIGKKGSHYDAVLVGVIVIVAIVIVLFAYGGTIMEAIEGVKTWFLALFGL